jgi:methionyl-tRNA formyltransferase
MAESKIVMWCGDAPNHRALANKVHNRFGIAAIVVDHKKTTRKKKASLVSRIIDRLRFRRIYEAWKEMMAFYTEKYPGWPGVPIHYAVSINSDEALDFTMRFQPRLIMVSGTNMVKNKMLSVPTQIGIINLHTGLSPYVKGGPNCTNWCIANNQWHLVGNTIMWINSGIDSGNIIVSETVDIRSCGSLAEAQKKVMEHAHGLYISAVSYLLEGQAPYTSIPQSELGEGCLYLTRMWSAGVKLRLLRNWRKRHKAIPSAIPRTVPLSKA